jgi:hypothetical protein
MGLGVAMKSMHILLDRVWMHKVEGVWSRKWRNTMAFEESKAMGKTLEEAMQESTAWNIPCHSPSDIEVLIHYNSRPVEHERVTAPAVQDAIQRFVRDGIFEHIDAEPFLQLTAKGYMWLEMICSVPYPETRLVDPDGRVVPRMVNNG